MNCPLVYPLCDQTVTVYRLKDGKVQRFLTEHAYLTYEIRRKNSSSGVDGGAAFRLILPGSEEISLLPGDRIYPGVGPEVTRQQWSGFLPATVPGLCMVGVVKPFYFMGSLCHTEAGDA